MNLLEFMHLTFVRPDQVMARTTQCCGVVTICAVAAAVVRTVSSPIPGTSAYLLMIVTIASLGLGWLMVHVFTRRMLDANYNDYRKAVQAGISAEKKGGQYVLTKTAYVRDAKSKRPDNLITARVHPGRQPAHPTAVAVLQELFGESRATLELRNSGKWRVKFVRGPGADTTNQIALVCGSKRILFSPEQTSCTEPFSWRAFDIVHNFADVDSWMQATISAAVDLFLAWLQQKGLLEARCKDVRNICSTLPSVGGRGRIFPYQTPLGVLESQSLKLSLTMDDLAELKALAIERLDPTESRGTKSTKVAVRR